jgi:hypothetical protein
MLGYCHRVQYLASLGLLKTICPRLKYLPMCVLLLGLCYLRKGNGTRVADLCTVESQGCA